MQCVDRQTWHLLISTTLFWLKGKRKVCLQMDGVCRWARRWIYHCVFDLPGLLWYSLRLPTKGWPGWVDMGIAGRVAHPSTNRARCKIISPVETSHFTEIAATFFLLRWFRSTKKTSWAVNSYTYPVIMVHFARLFVPLARARRWLSMQYVILPIS